jgi:phospholipase C
MDPIKHVIVLMLENHSFDQMLGFMGKTNPDINGIDETRFNINPTDGSKVYQIPTSVITQQLDPGHEFEDAMFQMQNNNGNNVANYVSKYPKATKDQIQEVMGYYPDGTFPSLHSLAKNFTVCDNWFGSLPGPTWPNRLFALSGTSLGHVDMPGSPGHTGFHNYDQTSIFDLLSEKDISWKIYCKGPAQSLVLMNQYQHLFHYVTADAIEGDFKRSEKNFPSYVFIEPTYGGLDQNDQHPPSNLLNGDNLIGTVYNALRKNKALWQSSLLVILYDENGGFYDHVTPPKTIAPDAHIEVFNFETLGFRVPALLISPNIGLGVDHTLYDHTSLLKYLCDKWGLDPNRLGKRVPQANSFQNLVKSDLADVSPKMISAGSPVVNQSYISPELHEQMGNTMLQNYFAFDEKAARAFSENMYNTIYKT